MKFLSKYFLLPLLVFAGCHVSAQLMVEDTTTNQPFLRARKFDSKGYVGIDGTIGQVLKKKAALNMGVSLNWVVNHKYVVTARYNLVTTNIYIPKNISPDLTDTIYLRFQFATLGFSYIFFHDKTFSFQPELSGGWAAFKYRFAGKYYRKDFGVIIPAVYGIYNATKYFRIGAGLNYRLAVGSKLNNLTDAYWSGVGGVVFIRVGTF